MKQYGILKVKDILVKSVHYVAEFNIWNPAAT
jgi:hypothetical protein